MRRFFWQEIKDGSARITGTEARHISRVLRMELHDKLILFDGSGVDYYGVITEIGEDYVSVDITEQRRSAAELPVELTIYQAVIKSDHLDFVVQKCTELGAAKIVPFLSERCVKRPDAKSAQKLVERECRIAMESSKQCGRSRIPEIYSVITLKQVCEQLTQSDALALLAYEDEDRMTIKYWLERVPRPSDVLLIIGPEGGFAPEEVQMLQESGAKSCSLGCLILRSETAGAAAAAMVQYHFMGAEK